MVGLLVKMDSLHMQPVHLHKGTKKPRNYPLASLSGGLNSLNSSKRFSPTSILWRATKWRSIKYEEVYLHAYDSVAAAKASIGSYFCVLQ
jgi:hypothetical protein